jgi:hypothetical protein
MDEHREPDFSPPPPSFNSWKLVMAAILFLVVAFLLYIDAEAAQALHGEPFS